MMMINVPHICRLVDTTALTLPVSVGTFFNGQRRRSDRVTSFCTVIQTPTMYNNHRALFARRTAVATAHIVMRGVNPIGGRSYWAGQAAARPLSGFVGRK